MSKDNKNLKNLEPGSIIGTSSFRREFQIQRIRKGLKYKLIRGNVETRIKKLKDGLYDAIILSYAGINSLGLTEKISQTFSTSEIIPSTGQGVVALQCRNDDEVIIELLKGINHIQTQNCVTAERNVLKILEGDCETAVGAYAELKDNKIILESELFSFDGSERFYEKIIKDKNNFDKIGLEMGKSLKFKSKGNYKR